MNASDCWLIVDLEKEEVWDGIGWNQAAGKLLFFAAVYSLSDAERQLDILRIGWPDKRLRVVPKP